LKDLLTTEELIRYLENQKHTDPSVGMVQKKRITKEKVRKVTKTTYWVVLGLLILHTIYVLIPMVFPHRAVDFLGRATMLAIPNDQVLGEELQASIIHVKKFRFDDVKLGDRIIIYGKFGTDLYWVEEVVGVDAINRTINTTFGYFIQNTYEDDQVIAVFDHHSNTLTAVYYVASTPRGFVSLLIVEAIILSLVYYYTIRDPQKKDKK
jgi:hypothetical protein